MLKVKVEAEVEVEYVLTFTLTSALALTLTFFMGLFNNKPPGISKENRTFESHKQILLIILSVC